MNPKRIAGETRQENFAHNVIERGLESAKHYAGGTKHEIERYSPQFIKKLENPPPNVCFNLYLVSLTLTTYMP